jgi:transcriptional regulator with XRE-family HTH domain
MTAITSDVRVRVGPLLRSWRQRRRLSQLELALDAGVSARHLSFVETGRARPSETMVLHLAEQLDVPLRARNDLLLAAGYAPVYGHRSLDAPELEPVRTAIDQLLAAHEPFPALVVDRGWSLVAANSAVAQLTEGVAPHLLEPPANTLRIALHPEGMAPRIANLPEWRAHLLEDLARSLAATGDETLRQLYDELSGYPGENAAATEGRTAAAPQGHDIFVPLKLDGMTFFSTRTTFGGAADVTVSELSVEAFFPADRATADSLRR